MAGPSYYELGLAEQDLYLNKRIDELEAKLEARIAQMQHALDLAHMSIEQQGNEISILRAHVFGEASDEWSI